MNKSIRTKKTLRMLSMRFSDGGATPPADPPAPPAAPPADPPAERTFTRDELNRAVAAEKVKAVEAYKLQAEQEKAEAEKLAKMNADEKLTHAQQQAQAATAELNAYKLKAEATRIAAEAGLPASFLDMVDFRIMKAEEVNALIEKMAKDFKASTEALLNEKLKQSPPETHHQSADAPKTLKEAIAAAMHK